MTPLKTAQEVREEFARKGLSISRWSVDQGLDPSLVHQVLSGVKKGLRGEAHRAAVLLGLKEGEIVGPRTAMSALSTDFKAMGQVDTQK